MSGEAPGGCLEYVETTDGTFGGSPVAECPFCGEGQSFVALVNIACVHCDDCPAAPKTLREGPFDLPDCGNRCGEQTWHSAISCASCGAHGPYEPGGLEGALAGWNGGDAVCPNCGVLP